MSFKTETPGHKTDSARKASDCPLIRNLACRQRQPHSPASQNRALCVRPSALNRSFVDGEADACPEDGGSRVERRPPRRLRYQDDAGADDDQDAENLVMNVIARDPDVAQPGPGTVPALGLKTKNITLFNHSYTLASGGPTCSSGVFGARDGRCLGPGRSA